MAPVRRWWPSWHRDLAVVGVCIAIGLLGMRGSRVPLLGLVDLGFHELGHLICYILPVGELATAAAGSVTQVAVPLGLALYFLVVRRDRTGGAVCLAWAATSALDASLYIADAPVERLPLIGGDHDWAFFFSAAGIDAMDRATEVAGTVASIGWALYVGALVVAVSAPLLVWARSRPSPPAEVRVRHDGRPFI